MKVELLRDWSGYKAGRIFPNMPDGQADMLRRRKIVRVVEDGPPLRSVESEEDGTPEKAPEPETKKKATKKPSPKK